MHKLRHNLLLLRHRVADVLTGPLALALLPITLLAWNAMGATIGILIAFITLPTLAVLAALADRHQRRNLTVTGINRIEHADDAFETALRAALYRGRLRKNPVLCMIIELNAPMNPDTPKDGQSAAEWTYDNAVLLGSLLRRRDQICVLGRNRFGVVMDARPDTTEDGAIKVARRLKLSVEHASTNGQAMLDALIGLCLSPQTGLVEAQDMIRAASKAVQTARGSFAPDVHLLPPHGPDEDRRSGILRHDIGLALEQGEIQGWFQPQVCARTGRVTGFETLARWVHPVEGVIGPDRFLPILEGRGMMPLLQERMLSDALSGFEAWRDVSADPPAVGVNFSPEDLLDPSLPDRIEWELDRRKIAPAFLNVEVLETVVSQTDNDVTATNIERLANLGCRIDLDDFGTGHASISSLRQFVLHRLKIDRSFVQGMESNPDQESMVAAILTMAGQLGLDTLAEGVETEGQEACLIRLGCSHLQGFAIARPMPLNDAVNWLVARQTDTNLVKFTRSRAV